MDRFKFRVWDCQNKFYLEQRETIFLSIDEPCLYTRDLDDEVLYLYDFCNKDYIVEQCTGLKDKNGNLIYEGDIVIEGGCKGVVKYGTLNCSCCDGVYGWYFDGLNGQTDIRCYEFCEVIGNIHEQKDNK